MTNAFLFNNFAVVIAFSNRVQQEDVFDLIKKHDSNDVINRNIVQLIQFPKNENFYFLLESSFS